MSNRILFVDDEERVLQGLQRMLRSLRLGWDMTFATSAAEALELLQSTTFDIVVSDMRMPTMSGAQLLDEVRRLQPSAIRFILSGQSSEESVLSSVGPAHQFLAKPCDPQVMVGTIRRAFALRDVLRDADLQRLLSQVGSLPSAPEIYLRLVTELRSPDVSVHRVASIVSEDVGMSAQILHFVNSAFFGIRGRVSEPRQAISLLGLSTVTSLVLQVKVFEQFDGSRSHALDVGGLASHSLAVAAWARAIARAEQTNVVMQDDTFTAALLHDVGKLVLASHCAEPYAEAMRLAAREGCPSHSAERQVLGADHARVGAYLLGLWGFSDPIVEALAYHHEPEHCDNDSFAPLTAVHAADVLQHGGKRQRGLGTAPVISVAYLERLKRLEALDVWRTLGPGSA